MKMNKMISMMLVGAMTMGILAGCGSSNKGSDSNTDQTSEKVTEDTTKAEGTSKVLVVYYSATGSTKKVAETIAQSTGGDLFEIEPKEPYTSDDLNWRNDDSRVSKEHDDESKRDVELVSTTVEDLDSYDTVFVGYPKMEYSL